MRRHWTETFIGRMSWLKGLIVTATVWCGALIVILITSGCGINRASTTDRVNTPPPVVGSGDDGVTTPPPGSDIGFTPITDNDDNIRTGLFPPYSFAIEGDGYSDPDKSIVEVTVATRSIVRVRFRPGVQNRNLMIGDEPTGYFFPYSKLAVHIEAGSIERVTALLSNGHFPQVPVQDSRIYDYSTQIEDPCDSDDRSCTRNVTIRVQRPNYDYHCITYGVGCTHTKVYEYTQEDGTYAGHPWNGTLFVETDDTDSLEAGTY